jgi:hypothetical protein
MLAALFLGQMLDQFVVALGRVLVVEETEPSCPYRWPDFAPIRVR